MAAVIAALLAAVDFLRQVSNSPGSCVCSRSVAAACAVLLRRSPGVATTVRPLWAVVAVCWVSWMRIALPLQGVNHVRGCWVFMGSPAWSLGLSGCSSSKVGIPGALAEVSPVLFRAGRGSAERDSAFSGLL